MTSSIAIVGAGMAGLSCATALAARGLSVTVFDKGRGPGGRMATRRAEVDGATIRFDHGAQYFTVRDPRFIAAVRGWREAGAVADWSAAGDDAVVGTPGMNGPIRHMADGLEVHWGARVDSITRDGDGWVVRAGETLHRFDTIVCAIPAEQAAQLLQPVAPEFAAQAAAVESQPCWALMLRFAGRLDLPDIFRGSAISWAARNASKPGRGDGENWVVHASPEWSRTYLELAPQDVAPMLLAQLFEETGAEATEPVHSAAHRWRFAMVGKADGPAALWDADAGLGVCGDWLGGPRVENAWISGRELADLIPG
ncbi:NAD(P)/FAD-dependent oxidoreductase [Parerythrobacter jejuensis]|uniref:FAD-dependent oxidoreductase n=1 Tax=Parerythrobacter jejuensis TaxID=795812 RepID=A0A845AWB1_9SPHN|nr:FAD-dependent oxidoreductase [Parerythrobacter jejuensis]MXP32796.1 FAD-dependent oxidoreductase [Parerythrobacter jejuensis]